MTSACYQIKCLRCQRSGPGDDEGGLGDQDIKAEGEPRRYVYIGQTGTTVHRRMLGHLAKGDSVLARHRTEYHLDQEIQEPQELEMKVLQVHKLLLERLVSEGCLIASRDKLEPGALMNGRGEFQKSKQVRFEPTVQRV